MFRYTTDEKGNPDLLLTPTDVAAVFGCTYQTGLVTVRAAGGRTASLRDILSAASDDLLHRLGLRLLWLDERVVPMISCMLETDLERDGIEPTGERLVITSQLMHQNGRFRTTDGIKTTWLRGKASTPWMQAVLSTWALILTLLGPDAVQPMFEAYDLLRNKRMRIRDGESIEIIDGRIIRAKNTRAGAGDPVLAAFLATALDLAAAYRVCDTAWAASQDAKARHSIHDATAYISDEALSPLELQACNNDKDAR